MASWAARRGSEASPVREVRRARWAVPVVFFVHGAVVATWVTFIPTVQQTLNLSTGRLGLVLLGPAIGSLLAMPLSGMLIARLGSRHVTVTAGLAYCAVLPLIVLAPSLPTLFLALVLFGACQGATDVAMNAQGV